VTLFAGRVFFGQLARLNTMPLASHVFHKQQQTLKEKQYMVVNTMLLACL